MSTALIITGIIVFLTHALEAVTGFGCTVLAFPFVTALLSIQKAKVLLTVIAWILALYFVITKFKDINFKQYGIIVFFAAIGFPFGVIAFTSLPTDFLKLFLGVFIVFTSVIQLKRIYQKREVSSLPIWVYYIILVMGGLIHGAFASGGPFIVLYAARALPEKGQFRATLCLLWTTLNTVLFITDKTFNPFFSSIYGYFTQDTALHADVIDTAYMLPFLVVGIIAGEIIHNKVNALLFKKIVFWVLLFTGIFTIISPVLIKVFS